MPVLPGSWGMHNAWSPTLFTGESHKLEWDGLVRVHRIAWLHPNDVYYD